MLEKLYLPLIKRDSHPYLPDGGLFSEREKLIYYSIARDIPEKEFPVFTENFVNELARYEFGIDELNLRIVTFAAYYKRVIGLMDGYFDNNRSKFKISAKSKYDLIDALEMIIIEKPHKYDGLTFSIKELLSIFNKLIRSDSLYSKLAQEKLDKTYKNLIEGSISALMSEVGNPLELKSRRVWNIKLNTNVPHANMIFDIVFANQCDEVSYDIAKNRFSAAKMAFQIKNDLIGIPYDFAHNNANLFIAKSLENGEFDNFFKIKLPTLSNVDNLELLVVLQNLMPKTIFCYRKIQQELFYKANLSPVLRQPIEI